MTNRQRRRRRNQSRHTSSATAAAGRHANSTDVAAACCETHTVGAVIACPEASGSLAGATQTCRAGCTEGANQAAPAASKAATPTLDLDALKEEVKSTSAIGVFTKLSLKNKVDDLLDEFRDYHRGKSKLTQTELRRAYDLLLMKVLSLLQDKDPRLASSIVASREAIWDLLADPKKFATVAG